jgi:V/A-type H+-transporting ATPase subunit A
MPVAAREASIYTGITIAEYFRDMGFNVALMADSTSRWAEALREIAGRMEEMPGEEGYPAYLSRKLAEFYERSGRVECIASEYREGSVSIVGAVSPPGGDISEPVSQGTLRITKAFWALDSSLARRRHYPAINWLKSYSLYQPYLEEWYAKNVSPEFSVLRNRAMELLQKEAELQNIVQLIGPDALPEKERLVLDATKMIREDFLQQFAFDPVDASNTLKKQFLMLKTVLHYYDKASAALAAEMPFDKIISIREKESIAQLKRVPEAEIEKKCAEIMRSIEKTLAK